MASGQEPGPKSLHQQLLSHSKHKQTNRQRVALYLTVPFTGVSGEKSGEKGAEEIELTEAQQAAAGAVDLYSLYPCV